MSYLPRMSKTYKEPQLMGEEPEEDISANTLKPASSLLNEKTHNPLMVLKHYRYFPHAPPVLPGPSVLDEVLENELYREASRMRRSASKMESFSKASEIVAEQPIEEPKQEVIDNSELIDKVKRPHSKRMVKGSKNNLGKKKFSKSLKRENTSSTLVDMCFVDTRKPFGVGESEKKPGHLRGDYFLSKNELKLLKREKSVLPIRCENSTKKSPTSNLFKGLEHTKVDVHSKEFKNRGVQCTIFGSISKLFVIPTVINFLLRTLAFLLHEINKEEAFSSTAGEKKTLMTQIQLILGDLCNQKPTKEFELETTYSDYKRLEIIFGELKKYTKSIYGDKSEHNDKMEDFKRAFIDLKKKEMELTVLNERLQDIEDDCKSVVLKESDLRNPEITLQNKRLESEQLSAEVEFSRIELRNIHKSIAEVDWDIKNYQGQMSSFKKSASKSKTEILGRKSSVVRFSGEALGRSKSKENENSYKKKTLKERKKKKKVTVKTCKKK